MRFFLKALISGFISVSFFSCTVNEKEIQNLTSKTIYSSVLAVDSIFDISKPIALKYKNEIVFNKLKFVNNKIFLFDLLSRSILIFDENGAFLNEITSNKLEEVIPLLRTRAKRKLSDVLVIEDFSLDEKNNLIFINSPILDRISVYDFNGTLIKILKVGNGLFTGRQMAYFDNQLVFYRANKNIDGSNIVAYRLKEKNFSTAIIKIPSNLANNTIDHTNNFDVYNGKLYYLPFNGDTIRSIGKDLKITNEYALNPKNDIESVPGTPIEKNSLSKVYQNFGTYQRPFAFQDLYISDSFVYYNYWKSMKELHFLYLQSKTITKAFSTFGKSIHKIEIEYIVGRRGKALIGVLKKDKANNANRNNEFSRLVFLTPKS